MEVIHVSNENKWLALNDEVQIGELNYKLADGIMTITRTEVDAFYRGNKIAEDMVKSAARYAQENEYKVVLDCSFAETVFNRNPELLSLLQEEN